MSPRVYEPKKRTILETIKRIKEAPKPPKIPAQKVTKKKDFIEKKFDLRNIFVIKDDQNILSENL